jgi:hypothetical protein
MRGEEQGKTVSSLALRVLFDAPTLPSPCASSFSASYPRFSLPV